MHIIFTHTHKSTRPSTELGADIILTLDECTPFHVDKSYTESSMERSHRWELRSLAEFVRGDDGTQVCLCVCFVSVSASVSRRSTYVHTFSHTHNTITTMYDLL